MTNSKNKNTTVELGFPIFEGQNHPHEKQFNFINNKISLMEKFKTESTNKELCEFIVVLESNDYFDFYSYQKQNLNTNYCFFTPEDSKHCGYTGREVSIKSKSDLNFKIQHRFVKAFYNHIMNGLVDSKIHDKTMVKKLFQTLNEFNSSQCFEEAA